MKYALGIIGSLLLVLLLAVVAYFSFFTVTQVDTEVLDETGETITLTGVVYENVQEVPADGNNFLMVDYDNGRRIVLYEEGGLVPADQAIEQCNNNQIVAQSAQDIQAGDTVEVYGEITADGHVEVCSNSDYYIRVIESAPLGNSSGLSSGTSLAGRVVTGEITNVIDECVVDGLCSLVVTTSDNEEVTVIWVEGDSPNCSNDPFMLNSDIDPFASTDQTVEAFGYVVDDNTISVCGSDDYYIRFGDEIMNDQNSEQTTRQVSGEVTELITDCMFDGRCGYVINTEDDVPVTVIWSEGMSLNCSNDMFNGQSNDDIQIGDTIEALGYEIDDRTISACGDESYYIVKTN